MKIIDFTNATCLIFDKEPSIHDEKATLKISNNDKENNKVSEKKEPSSKKDSMTESDFLSDDGILLPFYLLEMAEMNREVQVDVYDGTIIASQAEMTVLELLQAIESLEQKIEDYHRCLFENFVDCKSNENDYCVFSKSIQNNGVDPNLLKKQLEEMGFDAENNSILDISDNMLLRLVDMGLSLEEINYAVMEEEIVYFARNHWESFM